MRTEYINETILYLKGKIGITEVSNIQKQLEEGYEYTTQEELQFWQIYIYSRRRIVYRNIVLALGLALLIFLAIFFYPSKSEALSYDSIIKWVGFLSVCWIGLGLLIWAITQFHFSRLFHKDYISGLQRIPFIEKVITISGIKMKEDKPKTEENAKSGQ